MALIFAGPPRPLPPDFRLSPPSLRAERSNPESLRGTSLDCFVARAPRNDGGETLAPHGQRHHVIAVLDRALQHRFFQLEIETVGRADTTFRRKRAAEH